MAIWWPIAPISILVVVGALRYLGVAAIASIMMSLIIPLTFAVRLFLGEDGTVAYLVGGIATLLIILYALRPNIKRIFDGTERLVGPRAKKKRH
jgi:glycerol-3-phosphate acyltransferase PlsY